MSENIPAYRSLVLTVDHTTSIEPHVVQKVVHSTETLEETLVSLIKYYSEEVLLTSIETIGQLQKIALSKFPAVVYRTQENIQIIMAQATFDELLARSEGLLDCHLFILNTAGEIVNANEELQGNVSPLTVLDWSIATGPIGGEPEAEA